MHQPFIYYLCVSEVTRSEKGHSPSNPLNGNSAKEMSVDMKTSLVKEEEGRRVDLHTNSGETICLSFPENGTPLPKVIKLIDPDTGQAMLFQSNGSGYSEISGKLDEILSRINFELCHNCRNEEVKLNGSNELHRQNSGDERLEKRREKLQKKLKERKGSSNKVDEDDCGNHCHKIFIEIPVQGLSQIREDSRLSTNSDKNPDEDDYLSIEEGKVYNFHLVPLLSGDAGNPRLHIPGFSLYIYALFFL